MIEQQVVYLQLRYIKMRDVTIDTNILVLYIIGLIDPEQISKHKRTSIYNEADFVLVQHMLQNSNIITAPNIFTEVDNLLNDSLKKNYQHKYLQLIKSVVNTSIEKYIESKKATQNKYFDYLGLTDSIILMLAKISELLISGDSKLCDHAKALKIRVFDFKEYKNDLLEGWKLYEIRANELILRKGRNDKIFPL